MDTSFWFILWLLLSGALLYFLLWTTFILFRQKQAWAAFAKKYDLRYRSPQLFDSPEMNGTIKDYGFSFFASEHSNPDMRSSRKMTAIEVQLTSKMPVTGAIGSGGMVQLIRELNLSGEVRPKYKDWKKDYIAAAQEKRALKSYLNDDRLNALTKLMGMPNVWCILIFESQKMLLRIDTADPLDSPRKIEQLVKKLTQTVSVLELAKGEDARLVEAETAVETSGTSSAGSVSLDHDDESESPAFELEDDDVAPK